MGDPLRVLIVDDRPVFAEALGLLLDLDERIAVVGSAGDVSGARKLLDMHAIDVALVDVTLVGADGFAVTRELLADHPALNVVIMSSYSRDEHGIEERTRACGAAGFISKSADRDELVACLLAAAGAKGGAGGHRRSALMRP